MTVKLPDKPRKHRWVTAALAGGDLTLSVWPSSGDTKTEAKKKRFLETIAKVGNDPRVVKVEKHRHDEHDVVFLFHLSDG
ncbi:MAG: hypothetical protein ACXABY_02015 [Candidatus Thorarchaeota archaeon]|jgi:hypothetical protein